MKTIKNCSLIMFMVIATGAQVTRAFEQAGAEQSEQTGTAAEVAKKANKPKKLVKSKEIMGIFDDVVKAQPQLFMILRQITRKASEVDRYLRQLEQQVADEQELLKMLRETKNMQLFCGWFAEFAGFIGQNPDVVKVIIEESLGKEAEHVAFILSLKENETIEDLLKKHVYENKDMTKAQKIAKLHGILSEARRITFDIGSKVNLPQGAAAYEAMVKAMKAKKEQP